MSDQSVAESKIEQKRRALAGRRRGLGEPLGPVQSAKHGGFFQEYTRGWCIYWHPVMGDSGAHEVHGNILKKYRKLGGPDRHPETGRRELGFPLTDELRTADGLCPVSHFEWGTIYGVRGAGCVSIHGDLYKRWVESHAERGHFGLPITDHVYIAGGEVVYFERGCLFKSRSLEQPIGGSFRAPLLGRPALIKPDETGRLPLPLQFGLTQDQWARIGRNASLLKQLWEDRLALVRVGRRSRVVRLNVKVDRIIENDDPERMIVAPGAGLPAVRRDEDRLPLPPGRKPGETYVMVRLKCCLPDGTVLRDRSLYNVGFRSPPRTMYTLAPHAIYAKEAWDNFGLIHATDTHVSGRVERFRRKLERLGKTEGAAQFVNFNNGFRDMIGYANHLYDIGMLDFVLATGDLVDYVFERGANQKGGGNWALFEELILGQARPPDREGVKSEELRVPIFTVLGNHDYRPVPYDLLLEIDIADIGDWDFWPWDDKLVCNYASHNLTKDEAQALQGGKVPTYDMPTVAEQAIPETEMPSYYRKRINDRQSYVVKLGQHRIAMLDSRWDLGVLEGDLEDFLRYVSGGFSEEERDFLQANPDQCGFEPAQIGMVRKALQDASAQGLVIVGIHGPPLNPKGNEYPHYFRETEHPTLNTERHQVESFLRRQDLGSFRYVGYGTASHVRKNWPRTGTPYFKKGGIQDLLDYGISRGETVQFLKLCVGQGVSRPIDLVLCGHTHKRAEFRLEWDTADEFCFFTDFYTENPISYHPFYDYRPWIIDAEAYLKVIEGDTRPIFVRVTDRARLNQVPTEVRDHRTRRRYRGLEVPPYDRPLNTSENATAWWNERRPLIVQTSSVGPIDSNQRGKQPFPAYQGFRVISVKDNVIAKMHYVTLAELRRRDFEMPWESATPGDVPAPDGPVVIISGKIG